MTNQPTEQNKAKDRLAGLSPAKRALLEMKLKQKQAQAAPQGITRREDDAAAPLSFAQQRLWFLEELEPGSPAYHIPAIFQLEGDLDVAALTASLNEIVQRHEALRTTFTAVKGQPSQQVTDEVTISVPVEDLQGLPTAQREAEIAKLTAVETRRPFNLTTDPLLRACLLKLAPDKHRLILTMHHIASDGWSRGVLLNELSVLYKDFVSTHSPLLIPPPEGEEIVPSPPGRGLGRGFLTPLPIQYADFAVWQRDYLRGERLQKQLTYWKNQLAGAPPRLELPTDFPRPAVQEYRGQRLPLTIDPALVEAMKQVSQRAGTTLFMTLFAAFNVLLHRYSRQEDIVVGSPIANRTRAEIEGLIGFFVNTLVLRTDLASNPTFLELLAQVKNTTLDAYDHQDLPFEKLVEELQPERALSYNPIFQVMFVLHNATGASVQMPGLTVTPLEADTGTSKFDLALSLVEEADGMTGYLEYNVDLFAEGTMRRFWQHFQTLLTGIAADPSQPIGALPLMTEDERQKVVVDWNETTAVYPQQPIHQRFEQQAAQTPNAIAAEFPHQTVTYAELNGRANQLAHALQKQGIAPDVKVALSVERSLEMLVGLLGILKAGGTYVPLDPTYPQERLAYMLADSGAKVLLTQSNLLPAMPEHQARVICLVSDWDSIAQESEENPTSEVTLDDLIYIIYTSGSTGRPKGVALPQRAIANLLAWQLQNTTCGLGDKTLQFTTLSFDVSCQEIFATLCSGGTLVMIDEAIRRDPEQLAQLVAEKQVNRIFLPFVALQQLAEAFAAQPTLDLRLRELITAGEQLQTTPPIVALFQRLPNCRLANHYGPSETHVATAYDLPADPTTWDALPPIGKPIANTQIYLVDPHMQPVPVGVPGELLIGGDNVARGYLNRPELTAEKFTIPPFNSPPLGGTEGGRVYRTGDLARYRADGNIEYLGRVDQQVKIRGFRIEPGEIEAVLSEHEAVKETAVLAKPDSQGNKRLVAYVVTQPGQAADALTLRSFLKDRLPEYMVPALVMLLDEMPLTPSGKINRRGLPEPDDTARAIEQEFVAPRTAVEVIVAKIWSEILGVERVGVNDNFFDLGGHSLLATQVISRLKSSFKTNLPLRSLFESPTVAELAVAIVALEAQPGQAEKIATVLQKLGDMTSEQMKQLLEAKRRAGAVT
ncbi:non-ribosomal peptide synthetase [Candidatus Leptofilum sp.]|uniref:non-ribosomal peptide synthetase n=1 Tax=Candidatus Leptofilum sp. TaxID=3241576 RepID=UPI003B5B5C36